MQRQNQIVLLNSFYLTVLLSLLLLLLLLLNGLLSVSDGFFFCLLLFYFFLRRSTWTVFGGWKRFQLVHEGRRKARKKAPSAIPLHFNGSLVSAVHLPNRRLKVTGSKNTLCCAFLPLLPLNLIFHQCVRAPAVGLLLATRAWQCSFCGFLLWGLYVFHSFFTMNCIIFLSKSDSKHLKIKLSSLRSS